MVTVAAAAPAFAASPCTTSYEYRLDWGTTPYTRNSDNLGTATIAGPAVGAQSVNVEFRSTKNGTGARAADNLTVTPGGGIGGQPATEKALQLFHSSPSTSGYANRQDLVIRFSSPVTGLAFTISDIDSLDDNGNDRDYWDHVALTGTYQAALAPGVEGSGTQSLPWKMSNQNNSIAETNGAGNVRVTYAGSVQEITVSFWNGAGVNAKGQHAIFVNDLTFTTPGC